MISPLIAVLFVLTSMNSTPVLMASASEEGIPPVETVAPKVQKKGKTPKKDSKRPKAPVKASLLLKKEARKVSATARTKRDDARAKSQAVEERNRREAQKTVTQIQKEARLKSSLIQLEAKRKILEEKQKFEEEALQAKLEAEQKSFLLTRESEKKALEEQQNILMQDLSLTSTNTPAVDTQAGVSISDDEPSPELEAEEGTVEVTDSEKAKLTPQKIDWKDELADQFAENSDFMQNIILEGESNEQEREYFAREFASQESWFTLMLSKTKTNDEPQAETLRQKAQKFERVVLAQRVADQLIERAVAKASFSDRSRKQLRLMILYELNASVNPNETTPQDLTISQIQTITLNAIEKLSKSLAELTLTQEEKERRALAQELDALKDEVTRLKLEHSTIKTELETKTKENLALSIDISQSKAAERDLSHQLTTEKEKAAQDIKKVRDELETVQKELKTSQDKQKELADKVNREKHDLETKAALEKQLMEDKVKKAEESAEAHKQRELALNSQIGSLQREIVDLDITHKTTEQELTKTKAAIAAKEAHMTSIQQRLDALSQATTATHKEALDKDLDFPAALPIQPTPAALQPPAPVPHAKKKHVPSASQDAEAEKLLKTMLDSLEKR